MTANLEQCIPQAAASKHEFGREVVTGYTAVELSHWTRNGLTGELLSVPVGLGAGKMDRTRTEIESICGLTEKWRAEKSDRNVSVSAYRFREEGGSPHAELA